MITEDFSPEISTDAIAKYDEQGSLGADIVGGVVASVADFAASTFNSLVPESLETTTEDLLSRIDSNALRVYNEHPDTIHTASFVGGMLVPMGLAFKGMAAARNGVSGANFFSEAGRVAQKTKIAEAFVNLGAHSNDYKSAVRGLYTAGLANVAIDNVAFEAVMLLTMNAHPFMEDYVKNPVENFTTYMIMGMIIGSPLGHIADRALVKGVKMGAEQTAEATARLGYQEISSIDNLSETITKRTHNLNNWKDMLASQTPRPFSVDDPTNIINPLTKNMLDTLILKEEAALAIDLNKMFSPEMRLMEEADKAVIMNMIATNPTRFAGVDSIRFATAKEDLSFTFKEAKGLSDSTKEVPVGLGLPTQELDLPLTTKGIKDPTKNKAVTMVYSPRFDAFMLSTDMKYYGTAADLVKSPEDLTKGLGTQWHLVPRYDQTLENAGSTTSYVDADFLRTLKYYDELDADTFAKGFIAVSPDDISALSAINARIQKEVAAGNQDFVTNLKVTLTKDMPNFSKANEKVLEKVITNTVTKTVTIGAGGVTKTVQGLSTKALDEMTSFLRSPARTTVDLMSKGNSLSPEARDLAISFSTDQMWPLRSGIEELRRLQPGSKHIPQRNLREDQALKWGSDNLQDALRSGTPFNKAMELYGHEKSKLAQYAEEIINSKETQALKANLKYDSEGYTYLYRGMRGQARGHSAGESYTPDYQVALSFAGTSKGVSLYRVHKDEIIGALLSFGGKAGGEAEIVLDVPSRIIAGKPTVSAGMQPSGHTVTEVLTGTEIKESIKTLSSKESNVVDGLGIFDTLATQKNAQLSSLMAQGVPFETMSLLTNIPLETVKAYAASGVKDVLLLNKPISTYSEAANIPMHLANKERALALNTNLNKVPMAELKASLMKQELDHADDMIKDAFMTGSKSSTVRDIGNYLSNRDTKARLSLLRSELTNITDSSVSGRMFLSADQALRDLGALGGVITYMGKDTAELINKQVARIWEPMKPYFNAIAKDQVKTVELSTAMRVNAGLKGYREFKNGSFLVQDEVTPWIQIKDANGKVIGKKRNMIPVNYEGREFKIIDADVNNAVQEMQKAGRELYEMRKTLDTLYGRPPVNDIGFWVPPFNPRGNHIKYVWDLHEDKTTLLFGKTEGELQTAVNAFISKLKPGELDRRYKILDKSDQRLYNISQGRHDNIFMGSADSSSFHSGASAPAIVSTNTDVLVDLANGYDHYMGYSVRSLMDAQMSDVMARLDDVSYLSQKGFRDQPLDVTQKQLQKPHDTGTIIRNTLMGLPSTNQSEMWQKASELTVGVFNYTFSKLSDLFIPVLEGGKNLLGKGKIASDADYMKLLAEAEAKGIDWPFKGMDEHLAKEVYHVQQISQSPNMTPRLLAISNGLAATVMLRFGELAHPIVNMLSMPILTSLAMGRKLDSMYMDGVLNPNAKFAVVETMYNGARYRGTSEGKVLMKEAADAGMFKPVVSEATEQISQSRSLQPGVISGVEKFLNKLSPLRSASDKLADSMSDKLMQMLVKPADLAETITREQAFITGAYMAKEAYPGISKAGIMTYARDFMDKAIGNYSSAQRPVMFQGTLGVAMGLFQTYMLTMAQNIYRVVEHKNWAALAKTLLLQSSIFGTSSLPGFKLVSEQIGEHFSDQNVDLITGTYRALPNWMANTIIYGLPSNLGPSVTSRGNINPRIPDPFTSGINAIPAINILKQAYDAGDRVVSAAFTADASAGRAMLEALSLQSISRPLARMSELLTGTSITSDGNIMAGPEEVWTVKSVLSRTMGVRPIEEAKNREIYHLDTFYGSIDREARQKVTQSLKTHIRDGNLTPEIVESLGQEYMKTGTPSGWRGAVNTAIGQVENPTSHTVRNYLKPNSPFSKMINDLE